MLDWSKIELVKPTLSKHMKFIKILSEEPLRLIYSKNRNNKFPRQNSRKKSYGRKFDIDGEFY